MTNFLMVGINRESGQGLSLRILPAPCQRYPPTVRVLNLRSAVEDMTREIAGKDLRGEQHLRPLMDQHAGRGDTVIVTPNTRTLQPLLLGGDTRDPGSGNVSVTGILGDDTGSPVQKNAVDVAIRLDEAVGGTDPEAGAWIRAVLQGRDDR